MSGIGSESIRGTFLEFFERRSHRRIDGSSIVPKNDPTLLFVNSGMAPLKRYFTGEQRPPHPNLCNVQACIRTTDIDDVGDRHHLTFFEMLGSWSIGNYFKERAIELAYELLVDGYGIDPRRLYATVFAGDEVRDLPADDESAAVWERVGIPCDHIVALPAADNFWGPAGSSGPCGPCTEVFLDTGEEFGPAYTPGGEFDTSRRYIEIWNAGVFMQFDLGLDGVLRPLPITSVDTGSGLERMELALRGLTTVYESDLLAPTIAVVREVLGDGGAREHHHRVVTDHMRATTLILADGVRPGNEGRGYIPRRLIRRCVATALSLGHDGFPFAPVVESVIERLGPHYPRFVAEKDEILNAIAAECADFGRTVRRGLDRLDGVISKTNTLTGYDAFQLFTTYGLPVEIARDLAAERGATISLDDYEVEFRHHQSTSRGPAAESGAARGLQVTDVLPATVSVLPGTSFVGYDTLECEAEILTLLVRGAGVDRAHGEGPIDMIVDRTPFYGEGGGQVGDSGYVSGPSGAADVTTTVVHDSGRYLHRLDLRHGTLEVGDRVTLTVDPVARARTAANHSATHLVNAALRRVVGDHVRQAGSLVAPDRLRFDFTHPAPVTTDQLGAIERLVNEWILTDTDRRDEVADPSDAVAAGAIALPDEDYGDAVRVVSFPPFSTELCGGTHVPRTSTIGSFRIVSEQSVAAGIRRIVAVTRDAAVEHALQQAALLREVSEALHTSPGDTPEAARRLVERAGRRPRPTPHAAAVATSNSYETVVGDIALMAAEVHAEPAELRAHAQRLTAAEDKLVLLWSSGRSGRVTMVVSIPDRHVAAAPADTLMKRLAARLGGSGGGGPQVAQGGVPAPADHSTIGRLLAEIVAG